MDLDEARQKAARRRALQETRAVYRKADALYAPFGCPASADCCQLGRTGRQPWLWAPEWALIADRAGPPRADGGCPFLDPSGTRCTVYADRPLGCRTFFCHRKTGPSKEPAQALGALSRRLEAVSRDAWPEDEGPRPLLGWAAQKAPASR